MLQYGIFSFFVLFKLFYCNVSRYHSVAIAQLDAARTTGTIRCATSQQEVQEEEHKRNQANLQVELRHVEVGFVLVERSVLEAVHLPPDLFLVIAEIHRVAVVKVHLMTAKKRGRVLSVKA